MWFLDGHTFDSQYVSVSCAMHEPLLVLYSLVFVVWPRASLPRVTGGAKGVAIGGGESASLSYLVFAGKIVDRMSSNRPCAT